MTPVREIIRRTLRHGAITAGLEVANILSRYDTKQDQSRLGAIFTLHHVNPGNKEDKFYPNGGLSITPEFLDEAIQELKKIGFEFITMAELPSRLNSPPRDKPFAVMTLDDGYKNNRDYALPVFEKHNVPFHIFIASGFAERTAIMWWELVEAFARDYDSLTFDFGDGEKTYRTVTREDKFYFFDLFSKFLWSSDEKKALERLRKLSSSLGYNPIDLTAELTLSVEELRELLKHPLVSLGAHTDNHYAVGRLPETEARQELTHSAEWLRSTFGIKVNSLAFPYGNKIAASEKEYALAKDVGFDVAFTTLPGIIKKGEAVNQTGLPRISINGFYQKPRYVRALASGIPFRWLKS